MYIYAKKMYKTFFENIAEKVQHLPFGGVAKIKRGMLMTKENTNVVMDLLNSGRQYYPINASLVLELGDSKAIVLCSLLSRFQYCCVYDAFKAKGKFSYTQAELSSRWGYGRSKISKIISELCEEKLVSSCTRYVEQKKLNLYYFTKQNFDNIEKLLVSGDRKLKERLKRVDEKLEEVDDGAICSLEDVIMLPKGERNLLDCF